MTHTRSSSPTEPATTWPCCDAPRRSDRGSSRLTCTCGAAGSRSATSRRWARCRCCGTAGGWLPAGGRGCSSKRCSPPPRPATELMLDLKGRDARLARRVAGALAGPRPPRITVCSRNWALLGRSARLAGVRLVHSVGSRRQLRALRRRFAGRRLAGISIHRDLLDAGTVADLRARADAGHDLAGGLGRRGAGARRVGRRRRDHGTVRRAGGRARMTLSLSGAGAALESVVHDLARGRPAAGRPRARASMSPTTSCARSRGAT